ncbi:MAG: hypothetical protein ACLFR0_01875 [Alphaproteobacteria bacterium]
MKAAQQEQSIEYSIYVYHDPKKKPEKPWEMKGVTPDMNVAMKKAEELNDSREFKKVEVKKKFYDEKNARTIDMTLKTFEGEKKKEMGAVTLLAIGLVLCAASFAAAYFLTAQ